MDMQLPSATDSAGIQRAIPDFFTNGKNDTKLINRILATFGVPERNKPGTVIPVRSSFAFTVTDNATTQTDLTLAASWAHDPELQRYLGTGNDPTWMLVITKLRALLDVSGETPTVAMGLFRTLRVHWKGVGVNEYDEYVPLMDGGTPYDGISVNLDGAASQITQVRAHKAPKWQTPRSPLFVDLNQDTFEVGVHAAVDTSANVTGTLEFCGLIMKDSMIAKAPCNDDQRGYPDDRVLNGLRFIRSRRTWIPSGCGGESGGCRG